MDQTKEKEGKRKKNEQCRKVDSELEQICWTHASDARLAQVRCRRQRRVRICTI